MTTAQLFQTYQQAVIAHADAVGQRTYHHAASTGDKALCGEYTAMAVEQSALMARLAARITADLADDGWTYIVEGDQTTLPTRPLRAQLAYISSMGNRQVTEAWWYPINKFWGNISGDAEINANRTPYAWREWPTAPPGLLLTE